MEVLRKITAIGVMVAGGMLATAPVASADAESALAGPAGAVALGGGLVGSVVGMQSEVASATVKQTAAGVPAVLPLLTEPVRSH
ncbi:hypothetical protein GCM10010278_74980 [Streptomyces melanogenes]|nr:hypothetical protein GCM10010278_74980 [Streptomyces melanogenes]